MKLSNALKMSMFAAGVAAVLHAAPALAAQWVQGFYGPGGAWHPGHWVGGYGPPPGPYEEAPGPAAYGHHWVPGFYGPEGGWHRGYWAPN